MKSMGQTINDLTPIICAIVFEDGNPIRIFRDDKCIYKAYQWAHRHFCLSDYNPELKPHQLPEWLQVKLHILTKEQFDALVK